MDLRRAAPADAEMLSDLALRSKGSWGYDAAFLEACRAELRLDAAQLGQWRVVVAEHAGNAVAFYSLIGEPPAGELDTSSSSRTVMGRGIGRAMWRHMATTAAVLGFVQLRIESDPGARTFYEAMGARVVGRVGSGSIDGRWLPLLVYDVPPGQAARIGRPDRPRPQDAGRGRCPASPVQTPYPSPCSLSPEFFD